MPCLAADGDCRLVLPMRFAEGVAVVAVRDCVMQHTLKGRWISDINFGVIDPDWLDDKTITVEEIESLVRDQYENLPGVVRVDTVRATRDHTTDRVSIRVSYRASAEGETAARQLTIEPFGNYQP
jgi:hypothetical protein